ncbi:fatty acid desaturase CarF family protein [Leptospira idonii]|uniref:fatty acid desaturase CarF family protein n=1 Tax=Leptospira idonii TaxID=1193500 RepID=UPI0014385925|nr:fatty acid desaturase CarF family protein [Leptospira idonii]
MKFPQSFFLFCFFVVLTNQFHKWAHETNPNKTVQFIQNVGSVLSSKIHSLHHGPPFSSNYCITCGWLNPLFERIQFFQNLKIILEKVLHKTA